MEPPNPKFEQAVRAALAAMPAARLLGFTVGRLTPGEAELIQPVRPELTQGSGFVAGSLLGALADFAAGSAAATLLPAGWVNLTLDYTVKLLTPARGDRLIASGRVLRASSTLTVAAADLRTGATVCATALVTLRNVNTAR